MKRFAFILIGLVACLALVKLLNRDSGDLRVPDDAAVSPRPITEGLETRTASASSGKSFTPRVGASPDTEGSSSPAVQIPAPPAEVAVLLDALDEVEAEERNEKIQEIARLWSEVDPEGALAWAFSLEAGTDRSVVGMVLRDLSKTDPAGAFQTLRGLGPANRDLESYGIRLLFSRWAGQDPVSAWETAGEITDQQLLTSVEGDILLFLGEVDPVGTAATLDGLIASSSNVDDLSGAFQATANQFGMTDPVAASKWAEGLPEGSARTAATSGLVGSWVGQDFQATSTWLAGLPAGAARDAGIGTLVVATRTRDPETALQWVGSVSDPRQRSRLATMVSLGWLAKDPTAAQGAISHAAFLTSDDRSRIAGAFEQMQD